MKRYLIKEIFGPTLQGEGSHIGTPVLFIRFAGCNMWSGLEQHRQNSICSFCDTDFHSGEKLTVNDILMRLKVHAEIKTIVISGGEPTLQIDATLLSTLKSHDYKIHLETNGSRDIAELSPLLDHISFSPKQSREKTKLKRCDDIKILYPFIGPDITTNDFNDFDAKNKFIQPIADMDTLNQHNTQAAIHLLYKNRGWRLSLQAHKVWGVK